VKRAVLLAWAAAVLLLGVAALALGRSVHAVPAALHREDATIVAVAPGLSIGPRSTGERIARAAVGAPDRRTYFQALQLYADATHAAGVGDAFGDVDTLQGQHGTNELRIAGLLAGLRDQRERSQAATMLGTLIMLYSANGRATGGAQLVQQAVADFQDAIRSDPRNDAAKYDLELLLRLHAASERQQPTPKQDKRKTNARGGEHGTVTGNDY
jgi:hypothetical protein